VLAHRGAASILAALATGCASYTAKPLEEGNVAARYHAHRLDDPALIAGLDSLGISAPTTVWRDWELAAAAWLLRPERGRLLAEIRVAEAGRMSAGARPAPGFATETEYSFSGSRGESRFGLALSSVFTVELGGKRGARIALANARALAIRSRAEEEGWEVRWRVREGVATLERVRRVWELSREELALLDSVLVHTRARYADGATPRSEVARMEAERQAWVAQVAADQRDFDDSRAALATLVGISVAQLERTPVAHDSADLCEAPGARDSLEQLALSSRQELFRSLAEYQIAEAELRVEVANSWPDIALGPGLFFDHGVNKWTVAFGLPALPLNRNRGAIAEAEARREVAAHRVAETQEMVLGEVALALVACSAAEDEAGVMSVSGAADGVSLAEAAYGRGEVGRLEVAQARLELARAQRRYAEASTRRRAAGLALERAVGFWSGSPRLGFEREGM
jgi:outer membrane protein, heavy metal efflux system